ncbi:MULTISPECIES: cytochrome C oxidase subunit IV family protein [Sphingobium]|uniref:cytochrome C oxidase subunit IV family protein n=1 Tax=Sphingobium TaxID=165695 RepID=UPI0009FE3F4A|nr:MULTISPECIES: cytochrome C oxidase subunit IV family protein [Sphingobium]
MKNNVFVTSTTAVFGVLVVVTLLSFVQSVDATVADSKKAAAVIIAAAMIKSLAIIEFFLEVRHAHWAARLVACAWTISLGGILMWYLVA